MCERTGEKADEKMKAFVGRKSGWSVEICSILILMIATKCLASSSSTSSEEESTESTELPSTVEPGKNSYHFTMVFAVC